MLREKLQLPGLHCDSVSADKVGDGVLLWLRERAAGTRDLAHRKETSWLVPAALFFFLFTQENLGGRQADRQRIICEEVAQST